jgi:hypothetical protein
MFNEKHLINWNEIYNCKKPPELDFVMDGLLAGTTAAIVAPGATGKSFVALQFCISVSSFDILGMGIKSGNYKTAYITAEDPKEILFHRCFDMSKHLNEEEQAQVAERVAVYSLHGSAPCLLNNRGIVDEECEKSIQALKDIATGRRLIVIDTLRKFHAAEENDSGHMTKLTQILDKIAAETGCAVMFLHHANKGAMTSGGTAEQGASRGSSALVDNIRFQLNLAKPSKEDLKNFEFDDDINKFIKVIGAKANYRSSNKDFWLKRGEGGVLLPAKVRLKLSAPTDTPRPKRRSMGGA